jgi:ribose transport system substrate-binding protein
MVARAANARFDGRSSGSPRDEKEEGSMSKNFRTRFRVLAPLALVVAGAVLLGMFGGFASRAAAKPNAGAGSAADIVTVAKLEIAAARKPLTWKAPGPPINTASLKGKRILIASIDQRVPILAAVGKATAAAAKQVGIKVTTFDAKSQFPLMGQSVQQAIDQHVDGFVSLGLPIQALPQPFKKLKAAGIPSVTVTTHEPKANAPGQGGILTYANSAPDFFKAARLMADTAVVDTNGKANVAIIGTKEIGISATLVAGMRSVLDKCSGCKVQLSDVALADWATKITPLAQSIVRRDPNVNYILTIFDDMAIFATAGVNQAGASDRVKVAGFNGTPAALKLIQTGHVFTADAGQPQEWQGWHVLDQVMRGMLKKKPGNPVMPIRYFDDQTLKGLNTNSQASLYGNPAFKQGFKKLWGIKG